ncbi:MAG: hypothetical protein ACYTG5_07750 [Planctomycetota bacterium]|jgi:hypothetical protein
MGSFGARLLIGLSLACALHAQERRVIVQNLAPLDREEWVHAVVPFPRGEVAKLPELHLEGRPTVWQEFGARWPDGSLRQAICLFPLKLRSLEERSLKLVEGKGPDLPAQGFALDLESIEVIIEKDGKTHRTQPDLVDVLEENPARRVGLLRSRVGDTGVVAELTIEVYAGQAHAYVGLAFFFSDPESEAMQIDLDELRVETKGMALILRHANLHGVIQKNSPGGSRLSLLRNTYLGDGQGIRRLGALVPPLREDNSIQNMTFGAASVCPPLAATDWRDTGALGAFGYVPEFPPWLNESSIRTALARRHATFVKLSGSPAEQGNPFRDDGFGLARFAGQTGDQSDFGVVKMQAVAGTGIPSFLYEVEFGVLKEACRPVHFYEADGEPVQAADHPDWVVWDGRTHWHQNVSIDRLGKSHPGPRWERHGWTGKDRQHWSSNYISAFYLLTAEPQIRLELENEVQLYLAAQTLRPELTTSGPGAPRGAGRTLLSACWLYLCTGDERVLERMRRRMHEIYIPSWHGRDYSKESVRPYAVGPKDPRLLAGKYESWTPWQDSLAAIGFAAYYRITGDEAALELVDGLALNCLRHAWTIDKNGRALIAMAMRFKPDGLVLSDAERADPEQLSWSYNTAFSEWSVAALELGRQAAIRHSEPELEAWAERLQKAMRAGRYRPKDGWYDRFSEWDAIR